MLWLSLIVLVLMLVVFTTAIEKVKFGDYRDSSWYLMSFGIYEWGQAIVLAPFWIVFSVCTMLYWTAAGALRFYLLFHIVRAVIEILLSTKNSYRGLLQLLPDSDHDALMWRKEIYMIAQGLLVVTFITLLWIK